MKNWWVGCSGFHYKAWKGVFYPDDLPQRKWFEFYCQWFNTLELNVTFYRYPGLNALKAWYDKSPDDFRFTVKVPRFITHFRKFVNAKRQADDFYEVVEKGLKDKLGAVLFQCHPGMVYSEENLERIFQTINPSFINVLEFRDASWWNQSVYHSFRQQHITFCSTSYPDLPEDTVKTSSILYYRFHGIPQLYLSSYSNAKLKTISAALKKFRAVSDVYCYFNNDIEAAAVRNAGTMQKLVSAF